MYSNPFVTLGRRVGGLSFLDSPILRIVIVAGGRSTLIDASADPFIEPLIADLADRFSRCSIYSFFGSLIDSSIQSPVD